MKKIIVFVILAIFLMPVSVLAADLEISPQTVELDLVGGDSVQVNITINWSGSYTASCELTTNIEPDGEGINVTYSRNNFTMATNSENKIIMYINASLALMPGTYIITTNVDVEMEEQETKEKDKTYVPTDPDEPEDDEPEEDEPEDEEEPDDEEDEEPVDVDDEELEDGQLPILWIVGIILFVIMLLYLLKRRKNGEKPGEIENV